MQGCGVAGVALGEVRVGGCVGAELERLAGRPGTIAAEHSPATDKHECESQRDEEGSCNWGCPVGDGTLKQMFCY